MDPSERILVYLRIRAGREVVSRSKVRELRALGGLLADFMADAANGMSTKGLDAEGGVAIEYVDARDDRALVAFEADPAKGELVVSGQIPAAYRARMLGRGPDGASVSRADLERRLGERTGAEEAQRIADGLFESKLDLLSLIERAIDAEGRFVVRVPGLG